MRIIQTPCGVSVPDNYIRVAQFVDPDVCVFFDPSQPGSYTFTNNSEYNSEVALKNCHVLRDGVLWDVNGNLVDVSNNLGILERIGVRIITTHERDVVNYTYDLLVPQLPSEWTTHSKFIMEFTASVPLCSISKHAPPFYATRVVVYKLHDDPPKQQEEEDDLEECMICLSNRPDTLVVPCMHRVVCRECSEKLQHTPDRGMCVRCRREVEAIYHDEV